MAGLQRRRLRLAELPKRLLLSPQPTLAHTQRPTYEVHVGWLAQAQADGHALQLACSWEGVGVEM